MSASLAARAEVAKLARLLDADEDRLAGLAALPAADLRVLRDQIADVLYDSDSAALARAAAAAKVIPGAVAATISQKAFGPVLCARIAGMVDVARAVDVAKRLPIEFLADVSVAMDPRRASHVIAEIPDDHVVAVAAELARRDEHVTMGGFVSHLADATVVETFTVLSDRDLLLAGFVMDDKDRLDAVIGLLPRERLDGIIAAAHEHGLWAQALDLFEHIGPQRRVQLAEVVAEQDDAAVSAMLAAITQEGLWDALVPLVLGMGDEARARVVTLAGDAAPAALRK